MIVGTQPKIAIKDVVVTERFRSDAEQDIEILAASIGETGLIHPIAIDGRKRLLAGERRLLAHKMLGRTEVPYTVFEQYNSLTDKELTELRRRMIERDENLVRRPFSWKDECRLAQRIDELRRKEDPKWSNRKQAEATGVDKDTVRKRVKLGEALDGIVRDKIGRQVMIAEAMALIPELEKCESEDEAWKRLKRLEEDHALKSARSKLSPEFTKAPTWAEDHYRVGDAVAGVASLAVESLDFVEVDPPYAVDLATRKDSRNKSKNTAEYTEWSVADYKKHMKAIADACYAALKPDTFGIFWYGTKNHQITLDILLKAGFKVNPVNAIWYKGPSGQADQPDVAFASCYEPFFLVRKGMPKMNKPGSPNVFHFQAIAPSKKRHPTQKPLELMEAILNTLCRPGSKLCIPFLGSGVTLIAAYKLEMTGFGWDLSKENKDSFLEAVRKEFAEK